MLTFSMLVDSLKEAGVAFDHTGEPEQRIYEVFMGIPESVEDPDTVSESVFICLTDDPKRPAYLFSDSGYGLITVSDPQQQQAAYTLLRRRLKEDRRLQEALDRMSAAMLSNRGIGRVVHTLYELLDNPVMLWDTGENVLARETGDTLINPDTPFGRFVNMDSGELQQDVTMADYIRTLRDDEKVKRSRPINRFFNRLIGLEQITTFIRINGVYVAELSVFAFNHPLTKRDEVLIERTRLYITQELLKQHLYVLNPNENGAFFLNTLLSNAYITHAMINRLRVMREVEQLHDKYYVAVLSMSPYTQTVDTTVFSGVSAEVSALSRDHFCLVRETEMVILFNLKEEGSLADGIEALLKRQALDRQLMVGISNVFRDLTQIRRYYRQAKAAISMNNAYNGWAVPHFSDVAPLQAMHVLREHDDLYSYIQPELLELKEADAKNGTAYLQTLFIYLEAFGDTAAAAKRLHIHKNTMLYRLSRIREALNCSIDNGEDVYRLMMSLRIMRMLNLFSVWAIPD